MHNNNPTLVLRRNRRILRSKVYLLLLNNKTDKDIDLLKNSLKKEEFDEVIEDSCYYIPFPEKLSCIKEEVQTIEEIIDKKAIARVIYPKIEQKKILYRKPTILLPFQRKQTLRSQKTNERIQFGVKTVSLNARNHTAKGMIKKIDFSKSLIDVKSIKREIRKKEVNDVLFKYRRVFQDIEEKYHEKLRNKYCFENMCKGRNKSLVVF